MLSLFEAWGGGVEEGLPGTAVPLWTVTVRVITVTVVSSILHEFTLV